MHCIECAKQKKEKKSIFSKFFMTRRKNATQRNVRIESESILALLCIAMSVNTKVKQRNTSPCVIL